MFTYSIVFVCLVSYTFWLHCIRRKCTHTFSTYIYTQRAFILRHQYTYQRKKVIKILMDHAMNKWYRINRAGICVRIEQIEWYLYRMNQPQHTAKWEKGYSYWSIGGIEYFITDCYRNRTWNAINTKFNLRFYRRNRIQFDMTEYFQIYRGDCVRQSMWTFIQKYVLTPKLIIDSLCYNIELWMHGMPVSVAQWNKY